MGMEIRKEGRISGINRAQCAQEDPTPREEGKEREAEKGSEQERDKRGSPSAGAQEDQTTMGERAERKAGQAQTQTGREKGRRAREEEKQQGKERERAGESEPMQS